jgi:hypothetical protein
VAELWPLMSLSEKLIKLPCAHCDYVRFASRCQRWVFQAVVVLTSPINQSKETTALRLRRKEDVKRNNRMSSHSPSPRTKGQRRNSSDGGEPSTSRAPGGFGALQPGDKPRE